MMRHIADIPVQHNITLALTEQEALTIRQALDCLVRNDGLSAIRKALAVDDKIVAAARQLETRENDNGKADLDD